MQSIVSVELKVVAAAVSLMVTLMVEKTAFSGGEDSCYWEVNKKLCT